ncbi:MAG TPA: ABC transporter ATP-binding protein [Acidimicrobiales bacterium]|nr:ABC transporter ATP-binding protein [Acidimicrobiales bacterium]
MTTTEHAAETAGGPPPAVAASGITKRFPGGVVANDDVHLELRAGEVHALLGENGAGKSTLSNVLTGLYRPDAGDLWIHGRLTELHSPRDAIDAGIGMVHQHFRLVAPFTVAENVVLGERSPFRRREAEERVRALGERYRLPVDPTARIWQLSVGQQQRVEILKALDRDARILILDEPTAVLTPQESEALFEVMRAMADEGRAVLFISHKLDEVLAVSDRVTVLRDARNVGTVTTADVDTRELARMMVGREVVLGRARTGRAPAPANGARPPALVLDGVGADDDRGCPALHDVTLTVAAGEVLGVCGVAGNGQRELAEVVGGIRRATAGTVTVAGERLRKADPRVAHAAGVAHVPEDRLHTGTAPSLSVEDNLALLAHRRPPLSAGPFLRRSRIRARALELMARFGVKAPGPTTPVRLLSGGNVQKVLLARELSSDPALVVAASPTRGLDVGAIESVRATILAAADAGAGVLLISEDLDEVLDLSDRVAVMYEGRIVGVVDRDEADVTELGLLMGGATLAEVGP